MIMIAQVSHSFEPCSHVEVFVITTILESFNVVVGKFRDDFFAEILMTSVSQPLE